MMGSLFSSISGLKNDTTWINVIGNNISNVSTVGYKSSRITFKDAISQTLGAASGSNTADNMGGINAIQQGLGSCLGSIDTIMTQGALESTGTSTDVAIQGKGFFIVQSGSTTAYTRAGNFYFDNNGNLVTSSGALVQGWERQFISTAAGAGVPMVTTTSDLNTNVSYGNIVIPSNLVLGPKATSNANLTDPTDKSLGIVLAGNLDSMTPLNGVAAPGAALPAAGYVPDATITSTVYDSLGDEHTIVFYFTQTGDPTNTLGAGATASNWSWTAYDTTGGLKIDSTVPVAQQAAVVGSGSNVQFNSDGSLRWNGVSTAANPVDPQIALTLTNGPYSVQDISVFFGTDNIMSASGVGQRDGITGDYGNGTTDTAGVYTPNETVYTYAVDGYSEGTLTGISIDTSGGINCTFSNNQTITMAKLALANFINPEGLTRIGGTMFMESANSGAVQVSTAGNAGLGTTSGGYLEASNVDLSVELTDMIIAQRGYEANARIVSTSSSMLETLVNIGK
jgi:flagellar hook protein FlgE